MDLNTLYRQVIMDHYKNPRNKGLKGFPKAHIKNPSCGDDVTIEVKIKDHHIEEIHHEGTGCSICCSSASVMSEVVKGKDIEEVQEVIEDFYNLIKGEDVTDEERLDEAMAFGGVAQFPARMKCAILAWKALGTILAGKSGEEDV